jgi:hypothetical protein
VAADRAALKASNEAVYAHLLGLSRERLADLQQRGIV